MKHIVVPVDGSVAANRAAQFATQLAQGDTQVTLLFVYDAPSAAMLGLGALSDEQIRDMKASVAQGSFSSATAVMSPSPAKLRTAVELGHPGKEIVSYAKAHRTDLIVMGSRGQSLVQEVLMGSVSDYVVHHAHCPVTIVR